MVVHVRSALAADVPAIEALLAPEVARGTVLPRVVEAAAFLVAVGPSGAIVGCVGLAGWSSEVVELGSLVSALPGQGVGQRLVDAVRVEAARRGASTVVALTGLRRWFERQGFEAHTVAPWQLARSMPVLLSSETPSLDAAVAHKAASACAVCPLLARCSQRLMVTRVALPVRQVA